MLITDQKLRSAICRKVNKDAALSRVIRDLVATYTGNRWAMIWSVEDQGKRAEFLAELRQLGRTAP